MSRPDMFNALATLISAGHEPLVEEILCRLAEQPQHAATVLDIVRHWMPAPPGDLAAVKRQNDKKSS